MKGGQSEEAAAKEPTPPVWKDLKSATKKAPEAKKAEKEEKVADAPAPEPKKEKKATVDKSKKNSVKKETEGKKVKGAPDLSPLYKVEEKTARKASTKKAKEEEPTKIVVHIKAAEVDEKPEAKPAKKAAKKTIKKAAHVQEASDSEPSLFEKLDLKTPVSSMSSSIEDNDDFQGSVFEFENKVASSK